VPRLQPNLALLAYGVAISPSMGVADIRDWFPGPRELAQGPVGTIRKAGEAVEVANRTVSHPRSPWVPADGWRSSTGSLLRGRWPGVENDRKPNSQRAEKKGST
jgi:hypothetical protein